MAHQVESGYIALPSLTAASAGTTGANQDGTGFRGLLLFVNVSAISGTSPTLTVTIKGVDPVSGTAYTILASAAISATGFTVLRVYPSLAASANVAAQDILPPVWRVDTAITGTGPSVTATITACPIF